MRTDTINKKIVALVMAVLLVYSTALCNAVNVYGESVASQLSFPYFTGSSPYSSTGYSKYYHNKDFFDGNVIVNGVDVSAYQSGDKSDYKTAKENGVDFAIIRATFTYTGSGKMEEDSEWIKHFDKARDAGMMTGLYCFSQATSKKEAKAEANLICDVFEKHIQNAYGSTDYNAYLDMPIYMDYETSSGYRINELSKSAATSYADAFCQTIAERGYTPGIYASTSFLNNRIDGASLGKKYEIWVAHYWAATTYVGSAFNHWQYTSSAKIDGLHNFDGKKCNIDASFWYIDPNRIASSSNDIANCIISGAASCEYTGSALVPVYTVKSGDTTLKKGTDYTIGYANNIEAGTGYAYIRGIGDYSGYKLIPFEIKGEEVEAGAAVDETPYIELSDAGEEAGYKLENGELSGIVAGTKVSAIKAAIKLNDKYSDYSKKVLYKDNGVSMAASKPVTTGDKIAVCDEQGNMIELATLKVKGTKTKFTSVKGGKKQIKLKWSKIASSKATGYQVQYCLYKDMPSEYVGSKTYKSYKTTTATLSTNYSGTYYVRIRSYKTIRDKKNYSSWSTVKSVKVK